MFSEIAEEQYGTVFIIVDTGSGAFSMDKPTIPYVTHTYGNAWSKFSDMITKYYKADCHKNAKKRCDALGYLNPENDTVYETWDSLLESLKTEFESTGTLCIDNLEWAPDSDPGYIQLFRKKADQ